MTFADVNQDGKQDLLLERDQGEIPNGSAPAHNYVYVMLGNGDGTFQQPAAGRTVRFPAQYIGGSNSVLAVGSLTNDPSILGLVMKSSQSVFEALSNGDGTYKAPTEIVPQGSPLGVELADFNDDGKLDLAALLPGGLAVYEGNGNGTFGSII